MALTVTAGTPATAAQYNALVPYYLRQSSDQALATTTYTNHNTFASLAFAAGETWHLALLLQHDSANIGNGIKVRWSSTGGLTFQSRRAISGMGLTATSSVDVAGNFQMRADTDSVSGGSTTNSTNAAFWREEFVIACSTAGTLTMQWGQNAAITGSTTVRAGSFMVGHRLV